MKKGSNFDHDLWDRWLEKGLKVRPFCGFKSCYFLFCPGCSKTATYLTVGLTTDHHESCSCCIWVLDYDLISFYSYWSTRGKKFWLIVRPPLIDVHGPTRRMRFTAITRFMYLCTTTILESPSQQQLAARIEKHRAALARSLNQERFHHFNLSIISFIWHCVLGHLNGNKFWFETHPLGSR